MYYAQSNSVSVRVLLSTRVLANITLERDAFVLGTRLVGQECLRPRGEKPLESPYLADLPPVILNDALLQYFLGANAAGVLG